MKQSASLRGGVKQLLLVGGLAVLVACSSSSSTDNSESDKSEAGLTSAQVAKFESERVGLMASLVKLYPNGQLTSEQAAGPEVTDLKTGLIWRRCVESMVGNASLATFLADNYSSKLAREHTKSLSGWRIPNIKELKS